uniref:Uncharacterized protein n=1 Tax=Zooxanthella nutricula TaxID=1333877 RepID=A0A7S2LSF5_9DINO
MGSLRSVVLPRSNRRSFFGMACSRAVQLAQHTGQDRMVHMSAEVKDNLHALKMMRVILSNSDMTYFLDPATPVPSGPPAYNSGNADGSPSCKVALSLSLGNNQQVSTENAKPAEMSFIQFKQMLERFKVDTSKFGTGVARSLDEFYRAVIVDQKSFLVVEDNVLERVVAIVRVSLRIRDSENKLRELRLAAKQMVGGVHQRNQPLAFVLKIPERGQWAEAIERCFEEKLSISSRVQRLCFNIDNDSYRFKEERSASETIPGIMTTYKSHNIIINIKDKANKELKRIGLPQGQQFEIGKSTWSWEPVIDSKEDELMSLLHKNGIDVAEFSAQAFAELYDEVHVSMSATLDVVFGDLRRTIRIVKVWVHAEILNIDHVLVVRAKWQKGTYEEMHLPQPVSMRMGVDQEWTEAVDQALFTRLGLTMDFLAANVHVDRSTHKLTEEVGYSRSYPGLKTMYQVNEISVQILNTGAQLHIGLPSGTDFTFARREEVKGPETQDVVITHWCWLNRDDIEARKKNSVLRMSVQQSIKRCSMNDDSDVEEAEEEDDDGKPMFRVTTSRATSEEGGQNGRVHSPAPLLLASDPDSVAGPAGVIASLMAHQTADWKIAKRAAENIRIPDYSLKDFHKDITSAFPELRLYCVRGDGKGGNQTQSGRTADDEYQRTIGAMFAFYWIMRVDIDGQVGLCYGVDIKRGWQVLSDEQRQEKDLDPDENGKRKKFFDNTDWDVVTNLLVDSNLLRKTHKGLISNPDRALAMLTLLAIHDIMKIELLLPRVPKDMAEFQGYKAGDVVNDHDQALSFVMQYAPQCLPSFCRLASSAQQCLRFTHCKMDYNMGWLVQGEAPPGALFKSFRKVIKDGKAPAWDVAFYFVHWFCDLAAAEPSPLQGCEKFVLKFPHWVIAQFIDSFSVVRELANWKTETQVLEQYLVKRWNDCPMPLPMAGALPTGKGSIAMMRVMLMAQGATPQVMAAWGQQNPEDFNTIAEEMALTGLKDQVYEQEPMPAQGPAILVYYCPAFVQRAGQSHPDSTLQILAQVFRKTREIWPLTSLAADSHVVVRIDALKELDAPAILRPEPGFAWIMTKTSSKEAMVQMVPVSELQKKDIETNKVLSFASGRRSVPRTPQSLIRRMSVRVGSLRFGPRVGSLRFW